MMQPRVGRLAGVLVVVLLMASAVLPPAPAGHQPPFLPEVAPGFAVQPLASVPAVGALAFGPGDGDGPDLYATVYSPEGLVVRVPLAWTPAGPVAGAPAVFAEGFRFPLGLVFNGSALYVADSHTGAESNRPDGRVWRVQGGASTVIVDGLPNGRHNTNHLRLGPDARLYIANGNPNDNGFEGGNADVFPYSGAILHVNDQQVSQSPAVLHWKDNGVPIHPTQIASHALNADFAAKVSVLAWGFRNVYGVAFSPAGIAYTGMNGADEPSSQDALFRLEAGKNFSFPFCYNAGAPGAVGSGVSVVPNPVFDDAGLCAATPKATALLGWHTCATGLDFPTSGPAAFPAGFQSSVYVGECGPFFLPDLVVQAASDPGTATHNTGHKVVRVPLDAQGHATEVQDFLTGLALPTDVLFGPDGAMYVADIEGPILRIAPLPAP